MGNHRHDRQIREALESEGLSAAVIQDVVSAAANDDVDFDLRGKSEEHRPTNEMETLS